MARDLRFAYLSHYPMNAATAFGVLEERGELLEVACWSCGKVTRIAGDELVVRYGRMASLAEIYRRMKCASCGAGAPSIDTIAPIDEGPERKTPPAG